MPLVTLKATASNVSAGSRARNTLPRNVRPSVWAGVETGVVKTRYLMLGSSDGENQSGMLLHLWIVKYEASTRKESCGRGVYSRGPKDWHNLFMAKEITWRTTVTLIGRPTTWNKRRRGSCSCVFGDRSLSLDLSGPSWRT